MWYWISVGGAAVAALWLLSVPVAVAVGIVLVLGLALYVIDAVERSGPTAPSKVWLARWGKVLRCVGACGGILVIFESVAFQVIDSDLNQVPQGIPAMIHISLIALAGAMGYLVVYGDMTPGHMGYRSRRWTAWMLIGCVLVGTIVHKEWIGALGNTGFGQLATSLFETVDVKSASAAEWQEVLQVVEGTVFYADSQDRPEAPKEAPVKIVATEKLKRLSKAQEFEELRFVKVQRVNPVTGDHFGGAIGWVLVSAIETPEPVRHVATTKESESNGEWYTFSFKADEQVLISQALGVRIGDLLEYEAPTTPYELMGLSGRYQVSGPMTTRVESVPLSIYGGVQPGSVRVRIHQR